MAELRQRIRSPAQVYKSGHLLRGKHRAVLAWFLSEEGPVNGRGRVFLVQKDFFVLTRLTAVLGGDPVALYQRRPTLDFLHAANDVLRGRPGPLGPPWDEHVGRGADQPLTLVPGLVADDLHRSSLPTDPTKRQSRRGTTHRCGSPRSMKGAVARSGR
jgi:hypothetical protein